MLKGYKTVIYNLLLMVVAVIRIWNPQAILPSDVDLTTFLNQLDTALVMGATIGNLILRAFTDSTLFKKTSPAPMPEKKE